MSPRSSETVERVWNSSPHEQRTVATLYSGWMPCFMVVRFLTVGWLVILYPEPPGRFANSPDRSADVGALDGTQELGVGLALAHPVDHQLEGLGRVERTEHPAQLPGDHQLLLGEQQLLLAGGGGVDVQGREDAPLRQLAVQPHLHVPGALELLEDDLVHARAGVDQRGGQDRQRAAVLQVPRRAEEAL